MRHSQCSSSRLPRSYCKSASRERFVPPSVQRCWVERAVRAGLAPLLLTCGYATTELICGSENGRRYGARVRCDLYLQPRGSLLGFLGHRGEELSDGPEPKAVKREAYWLGRAGGTHSSDR